MSTPEKQKSAKLKALIQRKNKVLVVMHPPTAAHGRIMEKAGCEAGFVGTSAVVGTYTGLYDVGTASMTECTQIGGWIAQSVNYLIILYVDTGHAGIMSVRRLIRECIQAGSADIRIDALTIEGKRKTGSAGVEVVSMENAIARYRAAVDMKNELDPNFVIMAQCYAGNAANSSLDDTIARLKAYEQEAGVDWVQFEYPRSVEDIKRARAAVAGPFSFMKGGLPRYLGLKEHLELGVSIAWYPSFTHHVTWAALWDFMQEFNKTDIGAWEAFVAKHAANPYPRPLEGGLEAEGLEKQRDLEERYFSEATLGKYRK